MDFYILHMQLKKFGVEHFDEINNTIQKNKYFL